MLASEKGSECDARTAPRDGPTLAGLDKLSIGHKEIQTKQQHRFEVDRATSEDTGGGNGIDPSASVGLLAAEHPGLGWLAGVAMIEDATEGLVVHGIHESVLPRHGLESCDVRT